MVTRYLICAVGLVVLAGVGVRSTLFTPIVISTANMAPTLEAGDFVLASHRAVPRRGRVVIFRCPAGTCVARVVAVEGDRVDQRDGVLAVNLRAVEPETRAPAGEPLVVPPGQVFLVNDRREDAHDSREWGPLETARLQGRPLFTWLSLDWFDDQGRPRALPRPRWSRSFRSIR